MAAVVPEKVVGPRATITRSANIFAPQEHVPRHDVGERQSSGGNFGVSGSDARVVPMGVGDHGRQAARPGPVGNAGGTGRGHRDRNLDQDVLARVQAGKSLGLMLFARRAKNDCVDRTVVQRRFQIGAVLAIPVLVGERRGSFRNTPNEPAKVVSIGPEGPGVARGGHAVANDSESKAVSHAWLQVKMARVYVLCQAVTAGKRVHPFPAWRGVHVLSMDGDAWCIAVAECRTSCRAPSLARP